VAVAGPDDDSKRSIFRTMVFIAACDDALRAAISATFAAALGPDDCLVTT